MVLGALVIGAHRGEAGNRAVAAPRQRVGREGRRVERIEVDPAADRGGALVEERELRREPAGVGLRVGVRAGDQAVRPARGLQPRTGALHPDPPGGADAGADRLHDELERQPRAR